jgi:hypothetical protein
MSLNRGKVFEALLEALRERATNEGATLPADLADALQIIFHEYGQGHHPTLDAAFGLDVKQSKANVLKDNKNREKILELMIIEVEKKTPLKPNKNTDGAYAIVAKKLERRGIDKSKVARIWEEAIKNEWIGTAAESDIHMKGFSIIGNGKTKKINSK